MPKRFDQNRKEIASALDGEKAELLANWFDVDDEAITHVESEIDGEYDSDTDHKTAVTMDYAGVDWIVDDSPVYVGVADRVRRSRWDLSIRSENGTSYACEAERLPAAVKARGLFPRYMLFGVQDDSFGLDGAWMLNTEKVAQMIDLGMGKERGNGDGTAAIYLTLSQLRNYGAIVDTLVDP